MYGSSFDGPNNSPSRSYYEASNEGNKVNDAPRYYPSSAEMEPATPSSRYTAFEQLPASPQSYTPSTTFRDNVEYVHYNLPAGADRSYGSGASDHARPLQDYRGDYQESPASSPSQSYSNRAVSSRYDGEWSPYNNSVYPQNPYVPNSPTSVEGATAHPTLPPLAYPPASTGQMGSHTFPAKPPTPPHDHGTNPTHHPIQPHRSNWNTLPPIQPPYIPSPTTSTTVQLHFNQQQPHHQQRGQSPQDVHSYMGEISPPSIPASLNSPSSMTGSGTWYLTPAVFNWLTAVLDPKRRSDKSKPTPHGQCELCDVKFAAISAAWPIIAFYGAISTSSGEAV
ncbi:uncharacterized protein EI90DRAFT_3124510 [Cantharellus anzutake]|uniref:uncharacterized protein n=1 Tax=Cantharellus anzutake TaxID=1750568 RepID=UPI00190880D9|nr:uncharacterized protein EI90DRAFT_3124510 [Cantharellus anzutake]KAF8330424.1 hypothetical protein EI90DRAFT_3124510 [Cantharellus anzutake]